MLNRYSLWKYVILSLVLFVSLLYALPNLYGEDLAVRITGIHSSSVSKQQLNQIKKVLKREDILSKSITLEHGVILVRFSNVDLQLHAREVLIRELGENYVVALNLAPATPKWLGMFSAQPMKLGLDLRGGIHFLLEVDVNVALSKLQEKNINTLKNDLRDKGIAYTSIRTIDNGVEIFFRNVDIRNNAVSYLSRHYHNLIIKNLGDNALHTMIRDEYLREVREYIVQQNINILRNRINQLGISESIVQRQGSNYIVVELPGIQDTTRAKEILGATSTLEFRLVNTFVNLNNAEKGLVPIDSEVKWMREKQPIVLYKHIILTGDHIIDSTYSTDEYNRPQVNITLDDIGGDIMLNYTKNHIGKPMATLFVEYNDSGKKSANGHMILVKKEEVINVANIQSYFGKYFRVTGLTNQNEARQLSLLLRAGTLTAPVQIVEERIIGPAMGQQNITQGLKACLWSLVSSMTFIILYYKKFGVIAIIALGINLILIVSIMSLLPGITLTMPGIAGIVLTIAVSVDANVLINERIKEELKNGRTVQQAIHEGYKGAFSSIIDANVTTLIIAIVLYIAGTGSVKGFAVTTIIGLCTSMFTAIVGTRAIVNLLYGGKRINKLSI